MIDCHGNGAQSKTLSDDELMLYSRQILLDAWDIEAQLRLKQSTVLIVGMGGLGCPVAQILVRAGVGCLHLIDHDTIEISNLQRQVLFDPSDINQSKSHTAKARLDATNAHVDIHAHDIKLDDGNIMSVLTQVRPHLVIDASDNFDTRDLTNASCRALGTALLSASAIGELGQIALFTDRTGCYHCMFDGASDQAQNCATSGVLASTVAIIGSLAAQVALDFLGRAHNPIAGELVVWQGATLSLRKIRFDLNPDCPVCAICLNRCL